jgi:hypothetical protein
MYAVEMVETLYMRGTHKNTHHYCSYVVAMVTHLYIL